MRKNHTELKIVNASDIRCLKNDTDFEQKFSLRPHIMSDRRVILCEYKLNYASFDYLQKM